MDTLSLWLSAQTCEQPRDSRAAGTCSGASWRGGAWTALSVFTLRALCRDRANSRHPATAGELLMLERPHTWHQK